MFEKPSKDFDQGIVCEIVQDGYKFHDRLLRPAMVGIAKADENKKENLKCRRGKSKRMIKKQNNFLEKNKKIELLDSTATLLFPENCDIEF